MANPWEYLAWAQEELEVVLHCSITLTGPDAEERGMLCGETVEADSLVVSIPWESLLTTESTAGSPLQGLAEQGVLEDNLLSLLLLWHKHALGSSSQFHRHIQMLPGRYDSPLFWSEGELERLGPSSLLGRTRVWRNQVASDFEDLLGKHMHNPEGDTQTVLQACSRWLSYEEFAWAMGTVWSRFVTITRRGRQYKVMAPVFDMFNHSSSSQVVHGFQDSNDCLHIVTLQEWKSGEQIFLNYGPLSNAHLLLMHGFCLPDNPHDTVEVWATMAERAEGYNAKQAALQSHGVDEQKPFLLRECQPPDPQLLAALRVQRAGEQHMDRLGDAFSGALDTDTEIEACGALLSALDCMAAGYTGELAHELARLDDMENEWYFSANCHHYDNQSGDVPAASGEALQPDQQAPAGLPASHRRHRYALLLLIGEQKVLRDNITWLQDHVAALGDVQGR